MSECELFVERWEEFKKRWNHFVPIISVDKFIHDTIKEARKEYPVWERVIEDLEPDKSGFEAMAEYIKSLWRWIWRWW